MIKHSWERNAKKIVPSATLAPVSLSVEYRIEKNRKLKTTIK